MRFGRRPKYRNVKTVIDGHTFDSKKEAKRYGELMMLLEAGEIRSLILQPRFLLQEAFRDERVGLCKDGKPRTVRQLVFTADFQYLDLQTDRIVVEDVKSPASRTEAYAVRKTLFLAKFKDVDFREV